MSPTCHWSIQNLEKCFFSEDLQKAVCTSFAFGWLTGWVCCTGVEDEKWRSENDTKWDLWNGVSPPHTRNNDRKQAFKSRTLTAFPTVVNQGRGFSLLSSLFSRPPGGCLGPSCDVLLHRSLPLAPGRPPVSWGEGLQTRQSPSCWGSIGTWGVGGWGERCLVSKGERVSSSYFIFFKKRSSQDIRGGDEGATSQVYGIFEHEEVVEVAHQIPCQLVNKTAGVKETQYLELLKHNIDKVFGSLLIQKRPSIWNNTECISVLLLVVLFVNGFAELIIFSTSGCWTFSLPARWYWQRRCSKDNEKLLKPKSTSDPVTSLQEVFMQYVLNKLQWSNRKSVKVNCGLQNI